MMTSNFRVQFDGLAQKLSHLTNVFKASYPDLTKNAMERVSIAFLEYPVPPERKPLTEEEQELYEIAIQIKETQMMMSVLNAALQEEERSALNE
jgi:hypothetical protein